MREGLRQLAGEHPRQASCPAAAPDRAGRALASALAWQGAVWLFDDPRPFFAPIAAVIALNATGRRRVRQTVELIVGVAVGIGIADLLARVRIGTGAIQIGVVVAVALVAATAIDGGPLLFGQAASSGILVVGARGAGRRELSAPRPGSSTRCSAAAAPC